ncbi:GreA/GreB family elongation factor [Maribellus sp. CM-23]|uniref:hypothetical protein n=1 Tax=Maribellus sp. CM-23 TaxID=2781026 RepID=UPI001F3531CD|nr:hypothetical protein [Maribellus sp. CM-23]MCE4565357.1 GreA/GreB family elongation factor [Maribellus sp. CM-23]
MQQPENIKALILEELNKIIREKTDLLEQTIKAAKESRDNETKSSVGDKYETGRAMVQMELEKSQAQLAQTENLKTSLSRIDPNSRFTSIEFGSLVVTSQGTYFFSIAHGKIVLDKEVIFCLSPVSPVGKLLAGKKAGDEVQFQGKEIKIIRVE